MRQGFIITGGTSRLGRALVSHCMKQGHVLSTYFSSQPEILNQASDYQHQTLPLDLSVLTPQAADEFVNQCLGRVNVDHWILINNSSVFEYDFPGQTNFSILEKALKVNLTAPLMLTEALLKHTPQYQVTVIHILDAKLQALNPDYFSYTLSKQGLKTSLALYSNAHPTNAKFYGVAPAMFAESGAITQGRVEELVSYNPLHYPLSVNDIVHATQLAISGQLSNGAIVYADAGQHLMQLPRDVAYLSKDHFNANRHS